MCKNGIRIDTFMKKLLIFKIRNPQIPSVDSSYSVLNIYFHLQKFVYAYKKVYVDTYIPFHEHIFPTCTFSASTSKCPPFQ